jgi:putative SOS response-associated peptidase YedK
MCGRYVAPDERALEQYWYKKGAGNPFEDVMRDRSAFTKTNYNTAKTAMVPVEYICPNGPAIVAMRWGMDHQDRNTGKPITPHNARVEGYKRTPPFAAAWKKGQRCIQLVQGYYEWRADVGGKKVPYYIRPSDQGDVFGLAALWAEAADGSGLLTCAHITMPPNELLAKIHERMPAILRAEDHDAWLKGTADEAAACLKPYPAAQTTVLRVRPLVNSTKNNGPDLLAPDPAGNDLGPI